MQLRILLYKRYSSAGSSIAAFQRSTSLQPAYTVYGTFREL
jgi:hypothetical protein